MYVRARLIMQSYKPLKLEKGMLFIGMQKAIPSVFPMLHVPLNKNEEELYLQLNGYPVEPHIIIQGNPNVPEETYTIAQGWNQIGWFDEGDHTDELTSLTHQHINDILMNDGWLEIEIEEEEYCYDDDEAMEGCEILPIFDPNDHLMPVIMEGLVVVRYETIDAPIEQDDDDEEEECAACNGSGEGAYDGSKCLICGGSGVIKDERNYEPDDYNPNDDDDFNYHPLYDGY
jgi:hypothetical protein